jgi:TonB family protein
MLEQLERHEVEEQRLEPRLVNPPAYTPENDQRQRRRMVIALILLLVALGLVLIKDRDFWFPSGDVAESEPVDDQPPVATLEPTTSPAASAPKPVPPTRKKRHTAIPSKAPETVVPAPVVTASRAVLPPLRVDVVSNDQHQPVRPGSPSIKVEMQPGTVVPSVSDSAPAGTEVASAGTAPLTNAGERVQMSTDTRQLLSRPVRPEYPLLARQMKVQGKVALAASIGKDGGIQKLQVLGGPDILADAAREAVRQWRFKPYYQEGQPVETQANITVNFTIATD